MIFSLAQSPAPASTCRLGHSPPWLRRGGRALKETSPKASVEGADGAVRPISPQICEDIGRTAPSAPSTDAFGDVSLSARPPRLNQGGEWPKRHVEAGAGD